MMRFRISHKIAAIGLIGFGGLALVGGIYLAGDAAQEPTASSRPMRA